MTIRHRSYFFDQGILFECRQCGACCMGDPGIVHVYHDEVESIARYLSVEVLSFIEKYLYPIKGGYGIKEHTDGQCYFYQDGCTIYPVRPGQKELLGERAYASLDEIEEPVDMVNVFRKSEVVPQHAREAIRLQPKTFWMQLGIISKEAADILTDAGIDVIMDKCIKVEHARLCKAPSC